jgi:hypothetical protein
MGREQRKHERRIIGYPSTLLVEDITFPCHIIDVSAGGARLCVEDHSRIPDRFTVMLSARGARREVAVMWRRGKHIGVSFDVSAKKKPGAHEARGKYFV